MATEPGDGPDDGPDDGPNDEPEPVVDTAVDASEEVTSDDRTWGILTHISGLAGMFVPFGNILAPLVIWLIKKEESQFVDATGKEVLNFQISWTIWLFIVGLTLIVGIGVFLFPIIALAWLVLVVLGTVKASNEEIYDYPLTLDLIS